MKLVKKFNSNMIAEAARNLLKENGISSVLKTEGGIEFFGALGDSWGASLYVAEKDFQNASELLSDESE